MKLATNLLAWLGVRVAPAPVPVVSQRVRVVRRRIR